MSAYQVVYSVPNMFCASKHRAWRASTLNIAAAIAEVFTEYSISIVDLNKRFRESPEEFVVNDSDLSDEGKVFARSGFERWMSSFKRWEDTTTPPIEKYSSSLVKYWIRFQKGRNPTNSALQPPIP